MTLAVAFFGLTRSLRYTHASIERAFLSELRSKANAKIFCHFFQQELIINPRSGENQRLCMTEHSLLRPDTIVLESPTECLASSGFDKLKAYGDFWDDDFRSLKNLVHQLYSIQKICKCVLDQGSTACLFVRPDLEYLDPLAGYVLSALSKPKSRVHVPAWQNWGGFNDRFSLCVGRTAVAAWGNRLDLALKYCEYNKAALHAEGLVRFALDEANLPVTLMSHRARRVRANGKFVDENFYLNPVKNTRLLARRKAKLFLRQIGIIT